jgi:uncharacterized protein YhbP (UPF0306 family)
MTIATADREGRPWVSPVYYAVDGYREFVWVSDPDAMHSRNLAACPQIAIVIFDSTQPIDTGRRFRVYCATASDYSMIGPGMPRAPVNLPA